MTAAGKHAPGPWTPDELPLEVRFCIGGYEVLAHDDTGVAVVRSADADLSWVRACQFAAAPDLLAALRDMLDATTDECADALSLRIAQTNARAAIARAEGRS